MIIGIFFSIRTYFDERQKDRDLLAKEFSLAKYKEQKEIYLPLCNSVGKILASNTLENARPAVYEYFVLYNGQTHLIDVDPKVSEAKEKFYSKLCDWIFAPEPSESPPPDLAILGRNLVDKCKATLDLEVVFDLENEPKKPEASSKE